MGVYKPIQVSSRPRNTSVVSTMAEKGLDYLDLPQLLDPSLAIRMQNYYSTAPGRLTKRKGLRRLFSISSSLAGTMLEEYTPNLFVYAYGTNTAIYNRDTGVSTIVKSDWTDAPQVGVRYGDYFFVCNGFQKIHRISQVLNYDAQTTAFSVGARIIGATSGTKAIVLEVANYTPAFLTGDTGATSVVATWNAVTNGSFRMTINGTLRNILGLNFSSCVTMADVALVIQAGIRNVTKTAETCVWSTNRFIITSSDRTSTSAITVASAAPSGTDISGAGGTDFMDCDTGNGVVTNAVAANTGTLTLGAITPDDGVFTNNELITSVDESGIITGSATVDGTLGFQINEILGSSPCKVLAVAGARLFAGNTLENSAEVQYSNSDTGVNPPFTNWTIGTLATDPGRVFSRNAGAVNSIVSLGENIVVFSDNGKWAFQITVLDVGGTLTKTDTPIIDRRDFGGATGAITCAKGTFYMNESGLWNLQSLGQDNIPFSDQEFLVTTVLGQDYFDDADLSNCDIIFDAQRELILATYAKDSEINNHVIVYNTRTNQISVFTGWTINRFMLTKDESIFGISALAPRVFTVFSGYDDDGTGITTDFEQELKLGDLQTRQILKGLYLQGFLSPSTDIRVRISIYDVRGIFVPDKLVYAWTPSSVAGTILGYDSLPYDGGLGGDLDLAGLVEDFNGIRPWIRNWQRVRIRFTATDKLAHQINWVRLEAEPKVDIRRRNLTQI